MSVNVILKKRRFLLKEMLGEKILSTQISQSCCSTFTCPLGAHGSLLKTSGVQNIFFAPLCVSKCGTGLTGEERRQDRWAVTNGRKVLMAQLHFYFLYLNLMLFSVIDFDSL